MLKLSEKLKLKLKNRRKWLSVKAFRNCFFVSIGIIVIAWAFEVADLTLKLGQTVFPFNILWLLVGVGTITLFLWFYGLMAPDIVETIFKMLGFEVKEGVKKAEQSKN